jgi:hypothetical protein
MIALKIPNAGTGVGGDELDARIMVQILPRDGNLWPTVIDCSKARAAIHSIQEPGRAKAAAGAEFEQLPAGFARRQCAQQHSGEQI